MTEELQGQQKRIKGNVKTNRLEDFNTVGQCTRTEIPADSGKRSTAWDPGLHFSERSQRQASRQQSLPNSPCCFNTASSAFSGFTSKGSQHTSQQ